MLPFNPDSNTLRSGSTVVLRRGDERHSRRISAIRPHKRYLLLTFEGCPSMSAAEELVGYEVCVREADLPPTRANEVYYHELLGMTVVTTAGIEIGTVTEMLPTASNDVCVVRGAEREHLIPLVADIVKHIDREHRRLVIDPLPGLLDS